MSQQSSIPGKLRYLCLQTTQEGQASYAHVHEILAGLRRRGWETELFEPPHSKDKRSAFGRALSFIATQARFIRAQTRNPQPTYIRNHFAAYPASLFCRLAGIPVIREMNGPPDDAFVVWPALRALSPLIRRMAYQQTLWSTAIVTNTGGLRDWVRNNSAFPGPIETIANGANVDLFHASARPSSGLPDRYVIFFGAFSKWQGIDTILSAVSRKEWPEAVHVVFAGDGQERSVIENAVNTNPLVHYIGVIPYKEIPGVIAGAIAGVSPKHRRPSNETGWSALKVFEILSCGVPAIVSDLPGQAEVVRDGDCGIVVPPSDPQALALAVSQLSADTRMRDEQGARGASIVRKLHSWDARAQATHELLLRVLT